MRCNGRQRVCARCGQRCYARGRHACSSIDGACTRCRGCQRTSVHYRAGLLRTCQGWHGRRHWHVWLGACMRHGGMHGGWACRSEWRGQGLPPGCCGARCSCQRQQGFVRRRRTAKPAGPRRGSQPMRRRQHGRARLCGWRRHGVMPGPSSAWCQRGGQRVRGQCGAGPGLRRRPAGAPGRRGARGLGAVQGVRCLAAARQGHRCSHAPVRYCRW